MWNEINWQIVVSLSIELYLYLCFLCFIYLFTTEHFIFQEQDGKEVQLLYDYKNMWCDWDYRLFTTTRICDVFETTRDRQQLQQYVVRLGSQWCTATKYVVPLGIQVMYNCRDMWCNWGFRWCTTTEICGMTATMGDVQLQEYVVWLWLQVMYNYRDMWYDCDYGWRTTTGICSVTVTSGNVQLQRYVVWLRLWVTYNYRNM